MEPIDNRSGIIEAIGRKAVGYETRESVDEYALVDGELTLVKRRVTLKEVPPDVAAARMLLELEPDETAGMSEEELAAEKRRLILTLTEVNDAADKGKWKGKVRDGLVQKPRAVHDKNGQSGNKERD